MDPCPMCGGQLAYLGPLGNLHWFQCVSCGQDVPVPAEHFQFLYVLYEEDDDE